MPCILSTTFARPAAAAGENLLIRQFACVCEGEKVSWRRGEREIQTDRGWESKERRMRKIRKKRRKKE